MQDRRKEYWTKKTEKKKIISPCCVILMVYIRTYLSKSALIGGKIRKIEVSLLSFTLFFFQIFYKFRAKNQHFLDVRWWITFNICFKVIFYSDRNESIKMCSSEVFLCEYIYLYAHENLYLTWTHNEIIIFT